MCHLRLTLFPLGVWMMMDARSVVQELNVIFDEIDTDKSGQIDFDEFVTGVAKFVLEKSPNGSNRYDTAVWCMV